MDGPRPQLSLTRGAAQLCDPGLVLLRKLLLHCEKIHELKPGKIRKVKA